MIDEIVKNPYISFAVDFLGYPYSPSLFASSIGIRFYYFGEPIEVSIHEIFPLVYSVMNQPDSFFNCKYTLIQNDGSCLYIESSIFEMRKKLFASRLRNLIKSKSKTQY